MDNATTKPKKRIGYFDIAKCIAILFIVVGHTGIIYSQALPGGMPQKIVHFAFTFHLPVFFVASGYFFKLDTLLGKGYFKKAFRNIIVPYIVTCCIIVAGCIAMAFFQGNSMKAELVRWSQAALCGYGARSSLDIVSVERIGGIWFLLALFWAQVIILAAQRLPRPWLWIVGTFVVGWASSLYVQLPWSIQSGMCSALYVYAGALAHKHHLFDRTGTRANIALAVCAAVWAVYVIGPFDVMSFAEFLLPDGLFDVVGTFSACYVVFRFCKAIEHVSAQASRFMEWVGRNTLVIFCLHIAEDDVMMPVWQQVIATFSVLFPHVGWVVFLMLRLAFIALLCGIVYSIPKLNAVYFVSKRKKRVAPAQSAMSHDGGARA